MRVFSSIRFSHHPVCCLQQFLPMHVIEKTEKLVERLLYGCEFDGLRVNGATEALDQSKMASGDWASVEREVDSVCKTLSRWPPDSTAILIFSTPLTFSNSTVKCARTFGSLFSVASEH